MKCTKLLCWRSIRFFMDWHLILVPSDNLELAESVVVTFKMQKNDHTHEKFIHGRTDDTTLCPVLQWSHLINQVWTWRTHRSAQSGDTTDWNEYPHTRHLLPFMQHVQQLEALTLALKHMKLALILFDQEQRWRCTLPASLSIPSWLSADGQVTLSFVTPESKWDNFQSMLQSRCSCFDCSEQSQTLHLKWSPTKPPGNATIKTLQRQDTILGATSLNGCSYLLSSFSTDWSMMQKQLIGEASSHQLWKVVGGGESWNNFQFQTQPPRAHLVNLLLNHGLVRCLASKLLHWLVADRVGREQGLAD